MGEKSLTFSGALDDDSFASDMDEEGSSGSDESGGSRGGADMFSDEECVSVHEEEEKPLTP